MKRNFPSFLNAFREYAKDDVIPDAYTTWSGLSLIAAALERKVWVQSGKKITYPNIFILLVGHPGGGKSQAAGKVLPLVYGLQEKVGVSYFKLLQGVATAAGVCELMNTFTPTKEADLYSSLYYVEGEGSDSALKNHADDFRSLACTMYDCRDKYEKTLRSGHYNIPKPVLNMLIGSTFDFLKNVIDQNSVMGGLASRCTYVIDEKELPVSSGIDSEATAVNTEMINALTEDLHSIYQMEGRFRIQREAHALHEEWWGKHRKEIEDTESERLRSLLVRRPLLLQKAVMLYSASDRQDRSIVTEHMEKAIEAVDSVTKDCMRVISSAIIGNKNSYDAISQFIMRTLKRNDNHLDLAGLRRAFVGYGGDLSKLDPSVAVLSQAEMIKLDPHEGLTLLVDPDLYL